MTHVLTLLCAARLHANHPWGFRVRFNVRVCRSRDVCKSDVDKHRNCRRFPNPSGVYINIIQLLHVPCYILLVTSIDHEHITAQDASHHSETPRARRNEGPRLSCSLSSHRGRSRVWLAAGPVSCTRACGGAQRWSISSSRNPWDVIYLDFGQTAGNGLSSPTSKPDLIRKFRGATTQLLD